MPIEIPANSDLNYYVKPGMYYCTYDAIAETIANCPTSHAFTLLVEEMSNNDCVQTLKTWNDDVAYKATVYVRSEYPGWQSDWQKLLAATPPQIFNLPLVDGFSNLENVTSAYWKNQFGEATVILQAEKEQLINDGEIAAYLPAGFRPSAPQRFLCLGPTLRRPGFLYVDPDGSIKISFSGNAPSTDVLASFTFVAAT